MPANYWILPLAMIILGASGVRAQDGDRASPSGAAFEQTAPNAGQMAVPLGEDVDVGAIDDRLVFEPWQLVNEMFFRDDVVFVMRHGPTDWSMRDPKTVDPAACDDTRTLSEAGRARMFDMGVLLAHNGVLPGRILVSEWCRTQQTRDQLLEGMRAVDPSLAERIPVKTDPALNLLLHLDGAPNVSAFRDLIASWDGGTGDGPLLMISHYTNIEELTQFRVYEGEILVLDPDRDSRVLGYLRLRSAGPDVGHFPEATAESAQ